MTAYAKEYILEKLKEALETPVALYKKMFINYRGITTDTGEKYTEVLAEALAGHIGALESIQPVTRTNGYRIKTHDGTTQAENSNRTEERIALSMFGKEYTGIGKILDYQIPLKNSIKDEGLGKIDLISFDDECLRLLELKKPNSVETLLRCALGVYTYWRIADHDVLRKSYALSDNTVIGKAALIYKNSTAYAEYCEDSKNVRHLMTLLGVELFVLDEESGEIIAPHLYEYI